MKNKLLKILAYTFGGILGLALVAFAIYVYLFYPRNAEPFEINRDNPTKNILIATQGSDFKESLVKTLCDSLKTSSVYIKGIDVGDLETVNDEDWDRILIINSFIIRLNSKVDRFINSSSTPDKILLMVTSGGADWQPEPEIVVDALTSASRKEYIDGLINLIIDWMGKEDNIKWEPDDYLLAMGYFPRVDVKAACQGIAIERERYLVLYPNLVTLINQVGYLYIRLEEKKSALEIFKLNVSLFPDHSNVYDSYGEALLMNGEREEAIRNYQKALELNPESESAKDMLDKLDRD